MACVCLMLDLSESFIRTQKKKKNKIREEKKRLSHAHTIFSVSRIVSPSFGWVQKKKTVLIVQQDYERGFKACAQKNKSSKTLVLPVGVWSDLLVASHRI